MPQNKERHAAYMKERRQGSQLPQGSQDDGSQEPQKVNPAREPVNPAVNRRQWLRAELDHLKREYQDAQQDASRDGADMVAIRAAYQRINQEREPLFRELWEVERDAEASEQYWFPAHIRNKDLVLRHGN